MAEKSKKEKHEPTLYQTRGEFLAAAIGEKRKAFHNIVRVGDELWGFASSQHQFDTAVAEHLGASTTPLSKADIQRMIQAEFKTMLAEKEFPV